MLIMLCHKMRLALMRCSTKSRRSKLKIEIRFMLERIRAALAEIKFRGNDNKEELAENEKDWFLPDDIDEEWAPLVKSSETSGAICIITLTKR
mmetsp:Transcript_288/g.394  ORF Transcript_288/g.394 Transcript_288/m.394 type:complete len:93 (+) Transcript_288:4823-5101(+)